MVKSEPVRETIERSISGEAPKGSRIGLAQNPVGVPFQCGSCEYFKDGTCENPAKELKGRKVDNEWCCNLFEHEGMKRIV